VQNLISQQNSDGGWGKGRNYSSNPTDTALALKALSSVSYTDTQTISKAIGYLKSQQNTVGGWGSEDKGGMVQETSNVLSAFNKYRTTYQLEDVISQKAMNKKVHC
jgi:squalene cyclase